MSLACCLRPTLPSPKDQALRLRDPEVVSRSLEPESQFPFHGDAQIHGHLGGPSLDYGRSPQKLGGLERMWALVSDRAGFESRILF